MAATLLILAGGLAFGTSGASGWITVLSVAACVAFFDVVVTITFLGHRPVRSHRHVPALRRVDPGRAGVHRRWALAQRRRCANQQRRAEPERCPARGAPALSTSAAQADVAPSVEHLFGDSCGARSYLESRGIYLSFDALMQFACNVSGGVNPRYREARMRQMKGLSTSARVPRFSPWRNHGTRSRPARWRLPWWARGLRT